MGRGATLRSSSEVQTQLQKGMDEAEILLFGSSGDCFLRKASFSEPRDLKYTKGQAPGVAYRSATDLPKHSSPLFIQQVRKKYTQAIDKENLLKMSQLLSQNKDLGYLPWGQNLPFIL